MFGGQIKVYYKKQGGAKAELPHPLRTESGGENLVLLEMLGKGHFGSPQYLLTPQGRFGRQFVAKRLLQVISLMVRLSP